MSGYQLSAKVRELRPYLPVSGDFAVRLDANESFFNLADPHSFPPEARQMQTETWEEILRGFSSVALGRYPDASCSALREAFAQRYNLPAQNLVAGNGSDELIALICGNLLSSGTRYVTTEHDFSMYQFGGQMGELENILYKKDENLQIDRENLQEFLAKVSAEALVFSNPCNPTGQLMQKQDILEIAATFPQMLLVVDEAYMEFAEDQSVMGEVDRFENLMVLKTCSKALGLAGVRVGFSVAGKKLTDAMNAIRSPYNVNSLSQIVGTVVLQNRALGEFCLEKIKASKAQLEQGLLAALSDKKQIVKIYPSQTNFLYIKTTGAQEILENLKKQSITVRRLGDYLRINAGTKQENERVIEALKQIVR